MELFAASALLLIAGTLRFAGLRDLPPALWYDEAINGLDAWAMLRDGRLRMFFDTGGHPREPLFIWLVAAMEAVAGPTPVAIRSVSAIIGTVTVIAFWWMLKGIPKIESGAGEQLTPRSPKSLTEWLDEARVWIWAPVMALAALRWHVHFSRTCFRTIMTALMIILTLGFLMRAIERRRMREFALAGAALGAGFYTYLAFRFAPVIVLAALLHPEWRQMWWRSRADLKFVGVMAAAALFVLAPLLVNYAYHPEHFSGRMDQVTLFSEGLGPGLIAVGKNALSVAGMFSWPGRGDHVPKHNIPNAPVFAWTSAVFFYLGIGVAVWRARRRALDAVMLVWVVAILQASVWSFGAPNLLRTVGATPAVAYLLAMGWVAAACHAGKLSPASWSAKARQGVVLAVMMAIAAIFAIPQTHDYFVKWGSDPRVPRDFNDTFFAAADFANQASAEGAHVMVHDELYHQPTVEFMLLRSPEVIELSEENLDELAAAWREKRAPFDKPGPLYMIFTPTQSKLERRAMSMLRPSSTQTIGFFPVHIVTK